MPTPSELRQMTFEFRTNYKKKAGGIVGISVFSESGELLSSHPWFQNIPTILDDEFDPNDMWDSPNHRSMSGGVETLFGYNNTNKVCIFHFLSEPEYNALMSTEPLYAKEFKRLSRENSPIYNLDGVYAGYDQTSNVYGRFGTKISFGEFSNAIDKRKYVGTGPTSGMPRFRNGGGMKSTGADNSNGFWNTPSNVTMFDAIVVHIPFTNDNNGCNNTLWAKQITNNKF